MSNEVVKWTVKNKKKLKFKIKINLDTLFLIKKEFNVKKRWCKKEFMASGGRCGTYEEL